MLQTLSLWEWAKPIILYFGHDVNEIVRRLTVTTVSHANSYPLTLWVRSLVCQLQYLVPVGGQCSCSRACPPLQTCREPAPGTPVPLVAGRPLWCDTPDQVSTGPALD